MYALTRVRNWFIVTLIEALELRYDLREYKFEKKIVATRNNFGDDESGDDVRNKASYESKKFFGFASSSFQKLKKKIDGGPDDFGFVHNIFHDGTIENFVVKSVFGFLGGVILTYVCFLFLIYSLNFTLRRATLICVGLGVILSLGLAFSVRIRCTVLLCMPQLFSKRGRQALLAYAFILALSGPAKNTLHNIEVMSESLACGQEQLKKAENELLKCVHRPNTAVKQSLEKMILKLDIAVKGYKNFIEKFYRDCEAVIETIIHAQEWLYSIYCLCNEKMGSPYNRCTDLLCESSQNCKAISGAEDWQNACDVSTVQNCICPMRNDHICSIDDLPAFWPFRNHHQKLNEFRREALNLILVKIETHEIFTQPNRTATLREEYQGMATEIRQKTDKFLQYFDVMSVIFGIFILVLFIKVLIYRYKFLTEDDYDNRFITSDFVDIDRTRAEFGMQTLLPLELRERKKYIRVTSMRLVPHERKRLVSSLVFLVFATFKIIIHMLIDFSLYWMLWTMRRHGRMLLISSDRDVPQISITVSGEGLFAELLRNITKTMRPYAVQQILDPVPCLPDPISPDWNRYLQIMTLVLICWFLAFCEPYGLRFRHIVMITYHPDRARERAIWLYNKILTTRINFVKFARRQLRRKYKDTDEMTYYGRRCWIWKRRLKCLLCKEDLKDIKYIKCPTIGCVGIYCKPCFEILHFCSICKDPSYYGDYSDISEEKDSEDSEENVTCSRCHCYSSSQIHLRRAPTENYKTFHMTYDPMPDFRKWIHPKFKISMDTIVDLDESNRPEPEEGASEKAENVPLQTPSLLMKLVSQYRKAFRKNKSCEKGIPEKKELESINQKVELKETPSGRNSKSGKLTRKPSQSKKKQLFSGKALKGLRTFRKLKDRISDDCFWENSSQLWEQFKNVRCADVDLKMKSRKFELRRKVSSSSNDDHFSKNSPQEWNKSVENFSKLFSPDSMHLTLCPRRAEKFSHEGNRNRLRENCPVHGPCKSRSSYSKKVRKGRFQSGPESQSVHPHTRQIQLGDLDVQDDLPGLIHHKANSSSQSSSCRRLSRKQAEATLRRQKNRETIRRKRNNRKSETTSESSQEGMRMRSQGRKSEVEGEKVLAKKVETVKEKLAKFFGKHPKRRSSSEEGLTTEGDDCQRFHSEDELNDSSRKMIRPDILSDLPISKTSTARDVVDYRGDSDEYDDYG